MRSGLETKCRQDSTVLILNALLRNGVPQPLASFLCSGTLQNHTQAESKASKLKKMVSIGKKIFAVQKRIVSYVILSGIGKVVVVLCVLYYYTHIIHTTVIYCRIHFVTFL